MSQYPLQLSRIPNSTSKTEDAEQNRPKAYAFGISAFITIVAMQLPLKNLCAYFPVFLILAIRSSALSIIFLAIMYYQNIGLDCKNPQTFRLVIKRSIISAATMTMYLSSVQFIPIGIAATLFNTRPLFTFFVEALYFKKYSIQWIHVFFTLLCFCGIVLIIKPEFIFGKQRLATPTFHYLIYAVVILAAFTGTLSMIIAHDLRHSANEYVTLTNGSFFHTIPNYYLYILFKDNFDNYSETNTLPLNFDDVSYFLLNMSVFTFLSFLTQYFRIRSMYLAKPSRTMPFQYVSVVVGMLIDIFFFGSEYDIYMILGAILTSCGLLAKIVVENQEKKRGT